MRTLTWIMIGAVVLGAGLGILALVRYLRLQAARARNRAVATAACGASAAARVPIFVCLVAVGPAQAEAALRTMVSLFAGAACPLRVYIGVAEYTDGAGTTAGAAPNLGERFLAASKRTPLPFALGDHVRVLRAPLAEFQGVNVAREQVQRFLYHAEKYVLVLAAGALVVSQWDVTLPAALAHAAAGLTVPDQPLKRRVALTARLPPPTTPGTMGTYLGVHTARPTFVSFSLRAPASGEAPPSVPALAWSGQLSFSEGPLPLAGGASLACASDDDAVMTGRLWNLGWALAHPSGRAATLSAADAALLESSPGCSPDFRPELQLAPSVLHALGIGPTGSVTHRGRLGLVPGPNTAAELALKVGSTGDVLSMLSRIELQQRGSRRSASQTNAVPTGADPAGAVPTAAEEAVTAGAAAPAVPTGTIQSQHRTLAHISRAGPHW